MNCAFSNKHFSECAGAIAWNPNYETPLCGFHRDMLNEIKEVSERKVFELKSQFIIVKRGFGCNYGDLVTLARFDPDADSYRIIGEILYEESGEILEKLNKE